MMAIAVAIPAVSKHFIAGTHPHAQLGSCRTPLVVSVQLDTLGYFIVGMTNSAPSLTPEGQRAVTVFVFV